MRTRPVEQIVGQDKPPGLQNDLGHLADAVQEMVNFGSHVLTWMPDPTKHGDAQVPAILMFRHLLGLLDAVSLLLRQSSIEPCDLLLRGIFESCLGLRYLLEKDTEKRALAFQVWHTHDRMKKHRRLDPSTPEGERYSRALQSGRLFANAAPPDISHSQTTLTKLKSGLKEPHIIEAENEYQRTRSKRKSAKKPLTFPWYSLYDGPNTIEELASHLGFADLYEVFYREWSGPTHGTDVMVGKMVVVGGGPRIVELRNPKESQLVTQVAVALALGAYRVVVDRVVPEKEEELLKWYRDFSEFFNKNIFGEPLFTIEFE
jgi:hypothetical protein